jgi:hypothetical protein
VPLLRPLSSHPRLGLQSSLFSSARYIKEKITRRKSLTFSVPN